MIVDPGNISSDTHPIRDAIARLVAKEVGTPMTVEVLHDTAAAVLGEVSPKGTMP
jgi:hypothetical protein